MKFFLILFIVIINSLLADNTYSTHSNWLINTKSISQKFQMIQTQFRGYDLAMVEVGYRFNTFYFAIQDKNYDLARYQLDKIKLAIENGVQRREKRKKNSEAMFLTTQYKVMNKALLTQNHSSVVKEYEVMKRLCNACHVVEKVPFIHVIDPIYRWQPIK